MVSPNRQPLIVAQSTLNKDTLNGKKKEPMATPSHRQPLIIANCAKMPIDFSNMIRSLLIGLAKTSSMVPESSSEPTAEAPADIAITANIMGNSNPYSSIPNQTSGLIIESVGIGPSMASINFGALSSISVNSPLKESYTAVNTKAKVIMQIDQTEMLFHLQTIYIENVVFNTRLDLVIFHEDIFKASVFF